jgi:hypothetical protein
MMLVPTRDLEPTSDSTIQGAPLTDPMLEPHHDVDVGTVDPAAESGCKCCPRYRCFGGLYRGVIISALMFTTLRADRRLACLVKLPREWASRVVVSGAPYKLMLFSYSTICQSTLSLLACVPFEGRSVLLHAATVECFNEWQVVLIIVMTVLSALPFLVVLLLLRFVLGLIPESLRSAFDLSTFGFRAHVPHRIHVLHACVF